MTTPDHPRGFGYKQSWLALSCEDTAAAANAVGLSNPRPCSWQHGIDPMNAPRKSTAPAILVAPPIRGGTLIAGGKIERACCYATSAESALGLIEGTTPAARMTRGRTGKPRPWWRFW